MSLQPLHPEGSVAAVCSVSLCAECSASPNGQRWVWMDELGNPLTKPCGDSPVAHCDRGGSEWHRAAPSPRRAETVTQAQRQGAQTQPLPTHGRVMSPVSDMAEHISPYSTPQPGGLTDTTWASAVCRCHPSTSVVYSHDSLNCHWNL